MSTSTSPPSIRWPFSTLARPRAGSSCPTTTGSSPVPDKRKRWTRSFRISPKRSWRCRLDKGSSSRNNHRGMRFSRQPGTTAGHGCDVSEVAVVEACGRGVIGVCADLNTGALPYRSGAFDRATCLEVIEHVIDPLQLLRELHRVLRPAGRLILTTPNIRYFRNV